MVRSSFDVPADITGLDVLIVLSDALDRGIVVEKIDPNGPGGGNPCIYARAESQATLESFRDEHKIQGLRRFW